MRQFSYPNSQFTNILGGASIGWKLNVYDTGTTDYASIYSNLAQTTPTDNPVIADADGFLASFYWTGTVDVVLTDENNNLIDSANGIQDLVSTINAVVVAGNITLPFGTAAGDGDTITTILPIASDFSDGGVFVVRANTANSGASNTPNLQVNSYASRRIKKIGGVALIASDIVSGMNMILVYNKAQNCYYLINHEATFLKRDGTAKMLGAIDMDSHKITNLTAGTVSADAVNYTQLTTYTGNSAVEFAVAGATTGNSAVNRTQFDARTSVATTTQAGIVEKATQTEMNAGTADKFPSAAEIFSGFTNSSDGFKLPEFLGRWEIKTGTSTQSFGDTDVTITFSPAFASVCAFTIGIILNSSSSNTEDIWVQIKSKDASSVTFKIQGSTTITPASRTIQWFAIGK